VNMNTKTMKFDFLLKKDFGFEIKSQDGVISSEDLVSNGPYKFEKYFQDLKIKMERDSIDSAGDLGTFIDCIDRSNQSIGSGGIERMTRLSLINLKKTQSVKLQRRRKNKIKEFS